MPVPPASACCTAGVSLVAGALPPKSGALNDRALHRRGRPSASAAAGNTRGRGHATRAEEPGTRSNNKEQQGSESAWHTLCAGPSAPHSPKMRKQQCLKNSHKRAVKAHHVQVCLLHIAHDPHERGRLLRVPVDADVARDLAACAWERQGKATVWFGLCSRHASRCVPLWQAAASEGARSPGRSPPCLFCVGRGSPSTLSAASKAGWGQLSAQVPRQRLCLQSENWHRTLPAPEEPIRAVRTPGLKEPVMPCKGTAGVDGLSADWCR